MKNELALKQRIAELEKLLAQKDALIAALEERWRLAQQKQFGKSAEGFVGQGELFNEVAIPVKSLCVSHCQKTYPVSRLSTISPIRPVIAVAVSYIKWARINQKSLSLFQPKSK